MSKKSTKNMRRNFRETAHTTLFNGVMKFVLAPAVCRSWTGHGFCCLMLIALHINWHFPTCVCRTFVVLVSSRCVFKLPSMYHRVLLSIFPSNVWVNNTSNSRTFFKPSSLIVESSLLLSHVCYAPAYLC